MMKWVLASLMLAGCEGPPGPAGPAGADGADGSNGVDGSDGGDGADGGSAAGSYRWVDVTGAVVTSGPELNWFDENGLLWHIDYNTAGLRGTDSAVQPSYYESADCSGPLLVVAGASAPRTALVYSGEVYAIPDAGLPARNVFSALSGDFCQGFQASISPYGVRFEDLDHFPGGVPNITFGVPPLHPEEIQ